MTSVSLLLLAFLCARKLNAIELNDEVLTKIVDDFHKARQKEMEQFSFLLALKGNQCRVYQSGLYLNADISSERPLISESPDNFTAPLNYIAVHPNGGGQCSEYQILFNVRENMRVPEWFGDQIRKSRSLKQGGCVIFYTENTPCTTKCLSGKHFKDIVVPLNDAPFSMWRTDSKKTIHKYFVYGQVDNCDKDKKARIIHRFRCLDEGDIDPAGSFFFRKCHGEDLSCRQCDNKNDYCVNL